MSIRGDTATYAYSLDEGSTFVSMGTPNELHFSWWKGARSAIFAYNSGDVSPGYVDVNWLHYRSLQSEDK